METRAAVAHQSGKPLSIETLELDGPREGEVLGEIKATGVCHTDEFTRSRSLSDEGTVRIDDLSLENAVGPDQAEEGPDIKDLTLGEAEEILIHNALQACQGNVSAAARQLGVTRMTLRHRMQKYGISSRGSG